MALLASQSIVRAGLASAYAAASAGGDTFAADGRSFLHFKNTSGGAITVTIVTPRNDPYGNAIADNTVSIPATTGDRMVGPFPAEAYSDPTTGLGNITYSASAGLTVGAFQVTQ